MLTLPDWWTLKRLSEGASLNVTAFVPATLMSLLSAAKPYLGLTEGVFASFLASLDVRRALYLFLAAAGVWLFVVAVVFVTTPRPLRGQTSREAAIEAFKRAGGLSIDDGVTLTHIAWIDRSATEKRFARGFILSLMVLTGAIFFAGLASILRALLLLPA